MRLAGAAVGLDLMEGIFGCGRCPIYLGSDCGGRASVARPAIVAAGESSCVNRGSRLRTHAIYVMSVKSTVLSAGANTTFVTTVWLCDVVW